MLYLQIEMSFATMTFLVTTIVITTAINFERKSSSGILFAEMAPVHASYGFANVIHYFELNPYFQQLAQMEENAETMSKICEKLNTEICWQITQQFQTHREEMAKHSMTVKSFQHSSKQRRSLEFVGSFFNFAFGLVDAEAARVYDEKIDELQKGIVSNRDLLREQYLIFRNTLSIANSSLAELGTSIQRLDSEVNQMKTTEGKQIRELQLKALFAEVSQATTLTIVAHTKASQDIMNILQDSMNGKIINIVPLEVLQAELIKMADSLDTSRMLPIDVKHGNVYEIYKYIKTETVLINDKLIVTFKIPLLETDQFLLYRAISAPVQMPNETFIIVPDDEYFLVNVEKLEYIPISVKDLASCISTSKSGLICAPSSPSIMDVSGICSLQIMLNPQAGNIRDICTFRRIPKANYLISINRLNIYYFSIADKMTVRYSCRKEKPEIFALDQSGILKVGESCGLLAGKFKIRAHVQRTFNETKIISPFIEPATISFNSMARASRDTISEETILIEDHTRDFRRLSEAVDEELRALDHENKFEGIHYDSIGHRYFTFANAIITFIIFGICAGCIAGIWKRIGFVVRGYNSLLGLFTNSNNSGSTIPHTIFHNSSGASSASVDIQNTVAN